MAYFLNLFSPETWQAFGKAGAGVTGFRRRHTGMAGRVHPGDIFLCYMVRLSRWCGALEVESEAYDDDSPIFDDPDPFTVRFRVKSLVLLEFESSIPIRDDKMWTSLSITNKHEKGSRAWSAFFRNSLNSVPDGDGNYLLNSLKSQQADPQTFPLTEKDKRELAGQVIGPVGKVAVIPGDREERGSRESIEMQAKVAGIGVAMGFRIWVPRNNRAGILKCLPKETHKAFLEELPLNYDDTTLRTVEQIDVIWLNRRSMARAFEVEHTTAIYSGLLRMADLLALQPNMDIRLHIVAPEAKREKVLKEIRRPVFSLLERGPLYKQCSFLSYDSINSLNENPHLSHMSHSILSEYEESTEV